MERVLMYSSEIERKSKNFTSILISPFIFSQNMYNQITLSKPSVSYACVCASGEIGIHAPLRWVCLRVWRFKSSLAHRILKPKHFMFRLLNSCEREDLYGGGLGSLHLRSKSGMAEPQPTVLIE